MMTSRCLEIETRALEAEKAITLRTNSHAALKAAIDSAELYMQALRLADHPTERKRLDGKCKELLHKAEALKRARDEDVPSPEKNHPVSLRKLTTRENIIILEGAKLNGFVFKPWDTHPSSDDFSLKDGRGPFTDSPSLSLSETQLGSFGGWKRPKEALALLDLYDGGKRLSNEPSMTVKKGRADLVQDLTSDCSVVASLCSGTARVERGHEMVCHCRS
jgi:calpain-7